jgi:hypothetical protein
MVRFPAGMVHPRRRRPLSHHVEHIVGQDRDVETAIRLAKRMIVDGRMPSPEQARASLKLGQSAEEAKKGGKRTPFFEKI